MEHENCGQLEQREQNVRDDGDPRCNSRAVCLRDVVFIRLRARRYEDAATSTPRSQEKESPSLSQPLPDECVQVLVEFVMESPAAVLTANDTGIHM